MIRVFFTLFFISFISCHDNVIIADLDEPKEVRIDFQGWFHSDVVMASVDQNIVFTDTITTNPILGLAASHQVLFKKESHKVRVVVNGRKSEILKVPALKTEVVMVRYERDTHEISLEISENPILYW